jgi:hypothetical protein
VYHLANPESHGSPYHPHPQEARFGISVVHEPRIISESILDGMMDIKQLRGELSKVTSGWSNDTIFVAKAVMFLCDQVLQRTAMRPKSGWTLFFAAVIRSGITAREVS